MSRPRNKAQRCSLGSHRVMENIVSHNRILGVALICLLSGNLSPYFQTSQSQEKIQSPTAIPFCDLVKTPERYDKVLVRTRAVLLEGSEHSLLYDPACLDSRNLIWFEWDGYARALKSAGIAIQRKLNKFIKSDERALVTVVGTFQAKPDLETQKNVNPEMADIVKRNNKKAGFGHLGCCPHQIIPTMIEKVERVEKSVPSP